ncbi:MAG TPA: methyltransferase domain-containing protein [Alphaproteobacteria bacterium]
MSERPDIAAAAAYALQVIGVYDSYLSERGISWAGASILELGPGRDFAPQILMVDRGATVTVADRFLATWDPAYHPALYREVRAQVGASPALDRVIEQGGYDGVITTVGEPAESMPSIADGSFDIVFSNAVLEHVYDIRAVARELRRVSKPGAIHSHAGRDP